MEKKKLKVLDLFSGLKGWSEPFTKEGHEVVTLDFDRKFNCTITADILDIGIDDIRRHFNGQDPDIILASPPCNAFTVMRIGHNWTHDHQPKNDAARLGLSILRHTMDLCEDLAPRLGFIIENPRAKMRRMPEVAHLLRKEVTYCRYGETRMKPTDLFFSGPISRLETRARCKNGNPDHIRSPRGSTNGTQGGVSSAVSAKIPYALADAVRLEAELMAVQVDLLTR